MHRGRTTGTRISDKMTVILFPVCPPTHVARMGLLKQTKPQKSLGSIYCLCLCFKWGPTAKGSKPGTAQLQPGLPS